MANRLVWVDIPVVNLDRAIQFYSATLGAPVTKTEYPGFSIGLLPHEKETDIFGCLHVSEEVKPSRDGPLIYLNASGRLDAAEAAIAPNGGTVLEPRHAIGPHGFRVVALDSEGNRIAYHSM
jgi:uncharacterized protein